MLSLISIFVPPSSYTACQAYFVDPVNRILGGELAVSKEFPWMVSSVTFREISLHILTFLWHSMILLK